MSDINNDPNILMHVEIRDNAVRSYMADVDKIEWSDIEVDAVLTRIFSHREREKFFEAIAKNDGWFNNIQKYRT
ncbi:MAG TPA: hypothetical protein VJ583_06410 [Nitrososphaeraceae archaeon]|jgi:hypothetical protein|nr:hypothetical protein [Nitrososphaeraceae archaeon]